jgi:hypothetical protein
LRVESEYLKRRFSLLGCANIEASCRRLLANQRLQPTAADAIMSRRG